MPIWKLFYAEIRYAFCMKASAQKAGKKIWRIWYTGFCSRVCIDTCFIPKGAEAPLKSIIKQSELQVYVSDFGKKDDCCLVAETDGKIICAVWTRIMNDYGHIDDSIPSFAISLVGFIVVDENEGEYIMVCDL